MILQFDLGVQIHRLIVTGFILLIFFAGEALIPRQQAPSGGWQPGPLSPRVTQVQDTPLVLHPTCTESERRILLESLGSSYELVEYEATWPEYSGYVLTGVFGLACFWFLFSVVGEDWTEWRAGYVVRGKLISLAALYFSYAIVASLGWVMLWGLPFWIMGSILLLFGAVFKQIPKAQKRPRPPKPKRYLLVKTSKGQFVDQVV